MSVTLRKPKNSDGSTSLLLDVYHNGKRTYEFLKDLKLRKPANPTDRQSNRILRGHETNNKVKSF